MSKAIAEHYDNDGIAERVLAAARTALPAGAPITVEAVAGADHLHGRGLAATKELAALLAPVAGERILDIGSGIGGPARWIAATYRVHVTAIDLTPAFCEAARKLNDATGMSGQVDIIEGSATALPFADRSFDRAYSHNVIMNIADKPGFYAEAFRVLKPGGTLALMNLCAGPTGSMHYPTPWAATAATSFLATFEETREHVQAAGFEIVHLADVTEKVRGARRAHAKRLEAGTAPAVGSHLVFGPRASEFQRNSARSEEEGAIRSVEAVLRRP